MNSPLLPSSKKGGALAKSDGQKSFLNSFSPKSLKSIVDAEKKEATTVGDLKTSLAKIFKLEKSSQERELKNQAETRKLRERQKALDEEAKSEDKKNSSLRDKINSQANATWKKSKDILGGFFSFFQDMIKMFIAYKILDWVSNPKNQQHVKNILTFFRGVYDFIVATVNIAGKIFEGGIAGITATFNIIKKVTGGPVEVLFKIVKNVGLVFGALPSIQPAMEGLVGALRAVPNIIKQIVSTITFGLVGGVEKGVDDGVAGAGKDAGKEAGKGAGESAAKTTAKEAGETGVKSAGKAATEATAKTAGKAAGKNAAKGVGKGLGKSLLKKIPGVGLIAGGAFATGRAMQGDFLGAGMELASGVAGTMPGLGTAASIGIDAALAGRDIAKSQGIPMLAKGGLVKKSTKAVVGEAGPEAIVPLSRLGETVFGPDTGALSKTVGKIIPKFAKLLTLPFSLVGGGILAIMGGIAEKFPMLKPIIGMASGFIGNVFNVPKNILKVAIKGLGGFASLAAGGANNLIGGLGKLFGDKDPSAAGGNPPTVRGLLANILSNLEGKKKKKSSGGSSPAVTTPGAGTKTDSIDQSSASAKEAGAQGKGSQDLSTGQSKGASVATQQGQSSDQRRKMDSSNAAANRKKLQFKGPDGVTNYEVLLNVTNGDYEVYKHNGVFWERLRIDEGKNTLQKQKAFNQVRAFYIKHAQKQGLALNYITEEDVKRRQELVKKYDAEAKAKGVDTTSPPRNRRNNVGRASGGWISGPQSGYPVSLDGGRSTSFIGHGTEWVGMKKASGGSLSSAFVIPFDTPRTVNNPALTASRYREAKAGGYVLPYEKGGLVKPKRDKPPKPRYHYKKALVEQYGIPTGAEGSFRRYAAGGLYVFSTAPIGPPKMMGNGKGFSDTYGHHAGSSNPSPGSPNGPRPGGIPRDYLLSTKSNPSTPDSKGDRHPIRAGITGKVVSVGENWGAVMVADASGTPIFRSGHMSGIKVKMGQMINPSTIIGIQDSVGMSNGYVHAHIEAKTPALHNAWIRANVGATSADTGADPASPDTSGGAAPGGGGGGGGSDSSSASGLDYLKSAAGAGEFTKNLATLFSALTGAPDPGAAAGGTSTKPSDPRLASKSSDPTKSTPSVSPSPSAGSTPSLKPASPNKSGSTLTSAQSSLNQNKLNEQNKQKVTTTPSVQQPPTVINQSTASNQSIGPTGVNDPALATHFTNLRP